MTTRDVFLTGKVLIDDTTLRLFLQASRATSWALHYYDNNRPDLTGRDAQDCRQSSGSRSTSWELGGERYLPPALGSIGELRRTERSGHHRGDRAAIQPGKRTQLQPGLLERRWQARSPSVNTRFSEPGGRIRGYRFGFAFFLPGELLPDGRPVVADDLTKAVDLRDLYTSGTTGFLPRAR